MACPCAVATSDCHASYQELKVGLRESLKDIAKFVRKVHVSSLTLTSRTTQIRGCVSVPSLAIRAACSLTIRWLVAAETTLQILGVPAFLRRHSTKTHRFCHCCFFIFESTVTSVYPRALAALKTICVVLSLRLGSHRGHEKTPGLVAACQTPARAVRPRALITAFSETRRPC